MADHRRWYRITLEEPLILSRRNVTSGEHRTLDFIPGRVLLGLTARIYDRLGDDAWTAFHSGAVRFIDAVPETEDAQKVIPTPRCLQQIKRRKSQKILHAYNAAAADNDTIDDALQYTSLDAPYIALGEGGLTRHSVKKTSTVKTAIDPERGGTARDEHLFGYQALRRGQTFLARIDADDDVDASILHALEDTLVGSGRIGRSRSAEFGAVTIEAIDGPEQQAPNATVEDTRLRVVLTSDLALIDEATGAARLTPEAADFGLPDDWRLDLAHSFIRRRNYDRFNGHRKSFDLKRHVLQRGSVLSFVTDGQRLTSKQLDEVLRRRRRGVGVDRQEGLGQFLLEPAWMDHDKLRVDTDGAHDDDEPTSVDVPNPQLKAFVASRVDILTDEQREKLYKDAKKLAWFCIQNRDAPEKSQWSRLRRWAKAASITQPSFRALAGDAQGRLTKGWEVTFEGQPLGDYLVEYGQRDDGDGAHMLSELAHLVRANLVHHRTEEHAEETSP